MTQTVSIHSDVQHIPRRERHGASGRNATPTGNINEKIALLKFLIVSERLVAHLGAVCGAEAQDARARSSLWDLSAQACAFAAMLSHHLARLGEGKSEFFEPAGASTIARFHHDAMGLPDLRARMRFLASIQIGVLSQLKSELPCVDNEPLSTALTSLVKAQEERVGQFTKLSDKV